MQRVPLFPPCSECHCSRHAASTALPFHAASAAVPAVQRVPLFPPCSDCHCSRQAASATVPAMQRVTLFPPCSEYRCARHAANAAVPAMQRVPLCPPCSECRCARRAASAVVYAGELLYTASNTLLSNVRRSQCIAMPLSAQGKNNLLLKIVLENSCVRLNC